MVPANCVVADLSTRGTCCFSAHSLCLSAVYDAQGGSSAFGSFGFSVQRSGKNRITEQGGMFCGTFGPEEIPSCLIPARMPRERTPEFCLAAASENSSTPNQKQCPSKSCFQLPIISPDTRVAQQYRLRCVEIEDARFCHRPTTGNRGLFCALRRKGSSTCAPTRDR